MTREVRAAQRAAGATRRRRWYVYLIECGDGSLYTGVACDVARRVGEHAAGRGARYTRGRGPVRMVAASRALEKRTAYRLEWRVKRLKPAAKAAAVRAGAKALQPVTAAARRRS